MGVKYMAVIKSLSNHLLVAMPTLHDPNFARTVVYVCEQKEEGPEQGSVGLIINKTMHFNLSIVFEQLKVEPIRVDYNSMPLMYGGPVQPERGFVIHKEMSDCWRSSLALQNGMTVTTSNDIIRAIAKDNGPRDVLIALGYASWAGDELSREVKDNMWLVCPSSEEFLFNILYHVPIEERWEYAARSIGVNTIHQLSTHVGHA